MQNYISALIKASVQDFIFSNEHTDTAALSLQQKEIEGVPASWIAEQIKSRKKIKHKLPTWFQSKGIVYPPVFNLEQSSSELTAKYKAGIAKKLKAKSIADVSAGFGVDAFFFSQVAAQMLHVEPDENLIALAQHNHQLLGANNLQYHPLRAEEFINTNEKFDFIFIDPSRRSASGRKIFLLKDCEPDVLNLQEDLLKKAQHVLIKTSPMLDIDAGTKALQHVKEVYVLSVNNECKEVLFLLEANYTGEVKVFAVLLNDAETKEFVADKSTQAIDFSQAQQYLYEPDAAIIKAGMADLLAKQFSLKKLYPNTMLYTSENLQQNFPGRIFKVLGPVKLNRESLQLYFPDYAASISARNYPASAEALRKKSKLKEHDKFFLWAFKDEQGKKLYACERLH
ncbi:MAG TPA: hypothetical protein PKC24_03355 [Cyclobacteriaceae bacterium]|nr:hypothetical protein [Cyclobacteriaceae bacterium]